MPNPISALRRFLDHEGVVTLFAIGLLLLSTFVQSQTAVVLAPVPQLQFFDQTGTPLAFGCVFTYQVNSTSPLATYTDYTGVTQNANPVILTAGGSANIWLLAGQAYTFRVKSAGGTNCSSGSTLYTVNGIGGGASTLTTIVPYSSTPAFQDAAQNQLFEITLTGNASAQPLTFVGVTPPGIITFQITQDGSGGHTFSWPANSVGGCTIGGATNQTTTQEFVYNGTNATALGPCVTGNGPQLGAGNIYDYGLSSGAQPLCSDNFLLTSSCSAVLDITVNGQVITPGGSGNVNAGAAAHSLALNEGNGSAVAGLALGAGQIPIGAASANPAASTLPTCTNAALTYSGTPPLTCFAIGINYDFTFTTCTVPSGASAFCTGTVTFIASGGNTTPSFPAMADATYTVECSIDVGTTSNPAGTTIDFNVQGRTTTTFGYAVGNAINAMTNPQTFTGMCHMHHI